MIKNVKISRLILPAITLASALFLIGTMAAPGLKAQDSNVIGNIDEQALHSIIRDYIMDNPDVIIDALDKYQVQQREAEQAGVQEKLEDNRDELMQGPSIGADEPVVTIVEFFDYNCGYCKRAFPDIQQILDNHKDVKIVFKELPILSSSSSDAARWALAAEKQDKYWEFHSALMTYQGTKSINALENIANDLDLDIEKMRKDAGSQDVLLEIEENTRLSRELGIRGTPAFIIDDMVAPGYMGYDNMKQVIDQKREERS